MLPSGLISLIGHTAKPQLFIFHISFLSLSVCWMWQQKRCWVENSLTDRTDTARGKRDSLKKWDHSKFDINCLKFQCLFS